MKCNLADYVEEFLTNDQFMLPEGLSWENAGSVLASFSRGVKVDVDKPFGLKEMEMQLFQCLQTTGGSLELKKQIPVLVESFIRYLADSGTYPPASGWIADLSTASSHCMSRLREDGSLKGETFHKKYTDVGRNDECPCGSGLKFKKCCMKLIS